MDQIKTKYDYYQYINDAAQSLIQDYGLVLDDDRIYDAIHQRTDTAVIYYSDCEEILRFSNNDDAAFDVMGSECLIGKESRNEVNTMLAYYAYYQDLSNAVCRLMK